MKTMSMKAPTISPFLRVDKKAKKSGKCPIYFMVRLSGKAYKIPSGISVLPSNWISSTKLTRDGAIKTILQKKMLDFDKYKHSLEISDKPINSDAIKTFFEGKGKEGFLDFYEREKKRLAKKYEYNSMKGYNTNLNALKEFRPTLNFADLDIKFIKAFDTFLIEEREIGNGGRWAHHKNLNAMINRAISEEIMDKNPYKLFKKPNVKSKTIWLTLEEREKLEKLKLNNRTSTLAKVRDMFLFTCYTGLRFSDLVGLEGSHLLETKNGKFIEKVMKKTDEKNLVPLNNKAAKIFEEYQEGKGRIFPEITNQYYNKRLKQLAAIAKINKHVTSHIGRHTCASIAANQGKSILLISSVLGHKSVRTTQKYATVDNSSLMSVVED